MTAEEDASEEGRIEVLRGGQLSASQMRCTEGLYTTELFRAAMQRHKLVIGCEAAV